MFWEFGFDIMIEQWVIFDCLVEGDGIFQIDLVNDSFKNVLMVLCIIEFLVKKGFIEKKRFSDDCW